MPLDKNTIVIDRRDGLWRMRVHPDTVQMFGTREEAEARAQELACAQDPPWTVVVKTALPAD
jgi:hypothetical protein